MHWNPRSTKSRAKKCENVDDLSVTEFVENIYFTY